MLVGDVRFGRRVFLASALVLASSLAIAAAQAAADRPSAGGTQAWAARDAGPHAAYDQIGGMAVSPDGSAVYVARSSDGAFAVVAHDALTGGTKWAALTDGPTGTQIFADAVAISPDGTRLFVTGEVEETIDTRQTLIVAYDTADGSVLWSARLGAGDNREIIPRRITVSPDGASVFITGSRTGEYGPNDFWDYFTVGYSTDSGARLWLRTYPGPAHGGDTAEGIGVSPDGSSVFVTGTSKGSGTDDRDFMTIAYATADGSRQWKTRYQVGRDDFATDLVVSTDGSQVFVAGYGRPSISVPHVYKLLAYDAATGKQTGAARYTNGGDDFASSLAISDDGSRVFVTGTDAGAYDYLTVAFDTSTFRRQWSAQYDGGHGMDFGYGVAVSPNGTRLYVTGQSEEGKIACFGDVPSTAYATVSYNAATGAQRWVSHYAGDRDDPDQATQVAVSPDSSTVLVAGNSDSECTSSDVATVAYQG